MYRITQRIGIAIALGAVLLLAGCQNGADQADAPPPMIPEVAYVVVAPERVVLTTELPGRAAPMLDAEIRPRVNGIIQQRAFDEGADVQAGQLLYQLDDAPYRAALSSATADLESARSKTEQARTDLQSSLAEVERQRAILQLARTNRQRYEEMAADGAASQMERDRYATEAEVAEAALQAAQAKVNSDRQAIAVEEAGIAQAEAAIAIARINLDYTRITAPITGRIGKSLVTVGSLVTANQSDALATIRQLDPIFVDVPQSYGELLRLRRRMEEKLLEGDEEVIRRVRLILEDEQEYAHEGVLQFRDVAVDPSTNSVLIRVEFPNPEAVLLPGMFVRAIITEGVNPAAILVPQEAVSRDTKGLPIAMILGEDDTVEQRTLEVDRAIGNKWLVSAGLAPGEKVIVEGLLRVRHGSPARGVELGSSTADPSPQTDNGAPAGEN